MKRMICGLLFAALVLVAVGTATAQRDVVDKIAVVVGDRVILASELTAQVQLYAFQSGRQVNTEDELHELEDEVLQQMITEQLFLIEARQDTSITIRPDEIEQALDEHVSRIAGNFDSEQAFLDALAAEGLNVRELRKKYRTDVENQLLRQRFIQRKLYSVSVSRREVEGFYEKFKDSIPAQPEGVRLAHILKAFTPSPAVEDSVKNRISELRQMILDGADFATLAVQYSSMGTGANGGDLGYVSRDDVVPEFARAAFNLSVGDISGVIRTPFGYHVIKCEDKRGEQLKLRHLLLAVAPSSDDSAATIAMVDSLIGVARDGGDFAEMAKAYSDDNETRAKEGELGWYAIDQLPAEFADAVAGWKTSGEYRGPITSRFGLHILKLLEYQEEKQLDLDADYDRIKEMARQDKTGKLVDEWIVELKARTFVDNRL